ncbi:YfhO family protein [Rosettibacter firmus]|uniref:YfhO family protein n=1 Tax=Rosettibacter firmus TaxID=3111522 RepID=UPI00336C07EE
MKKQKSKEPAREFGFSLEKIIPEKFQTPFFLILIILLLFLFFFPVMFGDKTTSSGDLIQGKSLRQYALKERDGVSLWNPHIFCGIPAVVTSMSPRYYDLTVMIYSYASKIYSAAFKNYNALYTFNLLILAFTSFFFMRSFGASRLVSFLVAISTIFSTGILVLFYIGHTSKLVSLSIFPFILMMLFKFQKEIKILDVLLYIIGLHILIFGAHVQIVFYFGLVALIYFIYFFIHSFITKNNFLQKQLLKSLLISIVAGLIAIAMSYDTYGQLYEYKLYSTRGTKSIVELQNPVAKSQTNSYEYNTNWSFSPGEVLTFLIPSYYGFGRSTYQGPLTNNQPVEVNTYFGQMPFVDTAMYMGVIIFVLGLFTLFVRWKEPLIQFLGITVILFIFLSFGRNFPLIFNLFYYYFPFFDNFRTPSMILHVVQIIFPILAGFGLLKIISLREEKNLKLEKAIKNLAFIFTGLFILSILFNSMLTDWFTERVQNYASTLGNQQEAQMFNALSGYMADMFRSDFQIAMVLLALTFWLCHAYINKKVNKDLVISGLIIFVLIDLFRIGNRGASYVDSAKIDELFKEPEYVTVIKQQKEKTPFRILNLKQDGFGTLQNNANFHAYFLLEDFYGYSAVKPRSYQDIIDVVSPVNLTLWNMLSVKYIITDRPYNPDGFVPIYQTQNTFVYKNVNALPRVYFVDSVAVKSPLDILNEIKNESFNPKHVAFVENKDFEIWKTDSTTLAEIISYKDEQIIIKTKSTKNHFLFFSTTYLPGWKAFIDNNQTKIYKTNYGFQGIVVPEGEHKIEFKYEPRAFVVGKTISLTLNLLLYAGIIVVLLIQKKK